MAEVPVEINGVLYDLQSKSSRRVVLMGKASIIGLSVGGGPIFPPATEPPYPGGPPHPDHTLPGDLPSPEHPIVLPPGPPLVIWGPSDPRPTVPIYWPGFPHWPPTEQPPDPPPPDKWVWRYTDEWGWVLDPPGGGGKPQPVP
jgi:hypothetical protein